MAAQKVTIDELNKMAALVEKVTGKRMGTNHQPIEYLTTLHSYLENIITKMPGHVYWKNKAGVFLGCNMEQAKDAGFDSPAEMIGKTDNDMPWNIQVEYLRKIDHEVMNAKELLTLEEVCETQAREHEASFTLFLITSILPYINLLHRCNGQMIK